VIAGRTDLNKTSTGVEASVTGVRFPLTRNGFPRFLLQVGWDIALVTLGQPISQRPVRILGPSEQGILKPGRRLVETGWGTTSDEEQVRPKTLMMGRTNIQPSKLCGYEAEGLFETDTQICFGDSRGEQANCFGDSGGPAVVATSAGYRLGGGTSYGTTFNCGGTWNNVDAFVAGPVLRAWIRQQVLDLTGVDPVGAGGTADPVGGVCRIPELYRVTIALAKRRLRHSGCRKFHITREPVSGWRAKRFDGKITNEPAPPGWLWDIGKPIRLEVGYKRTMPKTVSPMRSRHRSKADATASIINGKPTPISAWPWQVAIASARGGSPWRRTFCGGSLVAPTMILTAAHCAVEVRKHGAGNYRIIAGRTNLNDTAHGGEVKVTGTRFARDDRGRQRYLNQRGWDVALLTLKSPVPLQTIKLLGPDEQKIASPGRRLIETGWGTTITGSYFSPKVLMAGGTNIQPDSVCRSVVARYYENRTQVCLGDSRGRQANCYGDSGGPAVVATDDGWRQVGTTSYGTQNDCAGTIPNVDTLSGGPAVRKWVQSTVLRETGVDPVGSGATADPIVGLCSVPSVRGKKIRQAKLQLKSEGCENVRVRRKGRGNRVRKAAAPTGWLWYASSPLGLIVGR